MGAGYSEEGFLSSGLSVITFLFVAMVLIFVFFPIGEYPIANLLDKSIYDDGGIRNIVFLGLVPLIQFVGWFVDKPLLKTVFYGIALILAFVGYKLFSSMDIHSQSLIGYFGTLGFVSISLFFDMLEYERGGEIKAMIIHYFLLALYFGSGFLIF